MAGQLNKNFVRNENCEQKKNIKSKFDNSFVTNKKGKSAGKIFVPKSKIPSMKTLIYLLESRIKKIETKHKKTHKIICDLNLLKVAKNLLVFFVLITSIFT